MDTETTRNSEDITELDKRMSTHEVMCDERWKTCFSRLDDLDSNIGRLETIALRVCGAIIVVCVGLIISIILMQYLNRNRRMKNKFLALLL